MCLQTGTVLKLIPKTTAAHAVIYLGLFKIETQNQNKRNTKSKCILIKLLGTCQP